MDKKTILSAIGVLLVVVAGVALYLWKGKKEPAPEPAQTATIDYSAPSTNPMEKAPDLSPTAKANPFTKVKTNPFE